MPGGVVCFEKRREYFLAAQSCYARKSCPNLPVWALVRLRKSTGLSVRLALVSAGFPAGVAFESDHPPLQSILYALNNVVQVNTIFVWSPSRICGIFMHLFKLGKTA
ncbi:MAG: hypothetical protein AXA67_11890 [Methylothermaceae bacteria B42]|nr:MAG: hypothetical protein AXA67_11890 [Methylothermaceae bacteria B42]